MIRRLGLLACVAGCLLSACGTSSADNPAASRSVRAAIATTDRQGTAHIVSLEQVKGEPDPRRIAVLPAPGGSDRFTADLEIDPLPAVGQEGGQQLDQFHDGGR